MTRNCNDANDRTGNRRRRPSTGAFRLLNNKSDRLYLSASGPMSKHPIGAWRGLLTRPRSHRAMVSATRTRFGANGWPVLTAADRRSHRAADPAGVSGSVAAGPRKAAVPLGRVAASEGCPEAGACPVAERTALRLMQATERSFYGFSDRVTPAFGA